EVLLELVEIYPSRVDSQLVDVAVQRLRAKVEDDPANPSLIRTVRGAGYKLAVSLKEGGMSERGVSPGRLRRRLTIAFVLVAGVSAAVLALGAYLMVRQARL